MTKVKYFFLSLFFLVNLTGLFAQSAFTGKTYISTGFYAEGTDITPIIKATGTELNIKIIFKTQNLCTLIMTATDANGQTDSNTQDDCSYTVDKKNKKMTIQIENESHELTYTKDLSQIKLTGSDAFPSPTGENKKMDLTIVFTESKLIKNTTEEKSEKKDTIDYGSVKTNIFSGKKYHLSRIEINGQDVTDLMIQFGGQEFNVAIDFISSSEARIDSNMFGAEDSETGEYEIDYEKNTITFLGSDHLTAIYFNKGKNMKISIDEEEMKVSLLFTVD